MTHDKLVSHAKDAIQLVAEDTSVSPGQLMLSLLTLRHQINQAFDAAKAVRDGVGSFEEGVIS